MSDWRDHVLREFAPTVSRLTLAADPDGLLLEEGIPAGVRERGFDLMPFDDRVAFRYAYETGFRSRGDRGEDTDLAVVLRSGEGDQDRLYEARGRHRPGPIGTTPPGSSSCDTSSRWRRR